MRRFRWLESTIARLPDVRSGRRWIDRAKRFFTTTRLDSPNRYPAMVTTFSPAERSRLLEPDFQARSGPVDAEYLVRRVFEAGDADGVMQADLHSYLPGDLLTLADRVSMRHGLEVRVPFLDHPLVELMASVPVSLKVAGRTKKVLMRESFRGLLPKSILALWLRTDLRACMQEILSETEVRRLGYLRYPEVERIKAEHLGERANHENKLWALMNLVCWDRQCQSSPA